MPGSTGDVGLSDPDTLGGNLVVAGVVQREGRINAREEKARVRGPLHQAGR